MDFRKQSVIFQNAKRVEDRLSPMNIVNRMMENDPFSRWLGIEVLEADAGDLALLTGPFHLHWQTAHWHLHPTDTGITHFQSTAPLTTFFR